MRLLRLALLARPRAALGLPLPLELREQRGQRLVEETAQQRAQLREPPWQVQGRRQALARALRARAAASVEPQAAA